MPRLQPAFFGDWRRANASSRCFRLLCGQLLVAFVVYAFSMGQTALQAPSAAPSIDVRDGEQHAEAEAEAEAEREREQQGRPSSSETPDNHDVTE